MSHSRQGCVGERSKAPIAASAAPAPFQLGHYLVRALAMAWDIILEIHLDAIIQAAPEEVQVCLSMLFFRCGHCAKPALVETRYPVLSRR